MTVLYFAYGSNMDCSQMRCRCRSARFKGIAVLPDHKLAFPRKSQSRRGGVAGAVAEDGAEVWGVLYEISESDLPKLDCCEGFVENRAANYYVRKTCQVFLDGDPAAPMEVWTYFAVPQPGKHLPSSDYLQQIIAGARFWGLPEAYIQHLEQIQTGP
ncbi:MAG: gamma-glutamylcyclotransferase family protein [Armatimonadota bacterium]